MLVQRPNPNILTTPYHYSAAWDASSGNRRQAEFAAGRFCAAKAIEILNPQTSRDVGIQADGSPLWPEGLVGSITHTEGFVSAAVASDKVLESLGIDSEKLTDPEALQSAKELILQDGERRLLHSHTLSEAQLLLLIFSAKESIYKCIHPLVRRTIDFGYMTIEDIDVAHRTFGFRLEKSLERLCPLSSEDRGRFEFSDGYVHTAVERQKKAPPSDFR